MTPQVYEILLVEDDPPMPSSPYSRCGKSALAAFSGK